MITERIRKQQNNITITKREKEEITTTKENFKKKSF